MSAADLGRPAGPASDAAGEAPMTEWAELLVARARDEGAGADRRERAADRAGAQGAPGPVSRAGMTEHLGCERHAPQGRGSGNSGNGSTPKTVTTEIGPVELAVPRDQAGTFEPVTVPKHRRLEGLSGNVISLYAKGLTTGDIGAYLEEIYDVSVSRETIPADHQGDRGRNSRVAEPAPRAAVRGGLDRRDRREGSSTPSSRTGPCMWRSAWTCKENATWGAFGWVHRAGRAPPSGRRC